MKNQRFGPIQQIGFVVDDLEKAALHWCHACGIGPFYISEHIKYRSFRFRGQETPIDLSLAFSYSENLQIELIKQHNDAPSVYREFLSRSPSGVVHVATFSDDFDAETEIMKARGNSILQTSLDEKGVETIYFETDHHLGGLVELIRGYEELFQTLDKMKAACQTWDGSKPIRYERPT